MDGPQWTAVSRTELWQKNGSKRDFQASANHTHSDEMVDNSKEVWTEIYQILFSLGCDQPLRDNERINS